MPSGFGSTVTAASRKTVAQSPSALFIHSQISGVIKHLSTLDYLANEEIAYSNSLLYLRRRFYQHIERHRRTQFPADFRHLVQFVPFIWHNDQQIDVRIFIR